MMNTAYSHQNHNTYSAANVVNHSDNAISDSSITRRVTEVIIPQEHNSNAIVLPLAASLTQQSGQRWLTWITHRKPSKQSLLQLGAKIQRLRIIHTHPADDNRWIIWEALSAGNSHTVIADLDFLSREEQQVMEAAANKGNCSGIITRSV